MTTIHIDSPRRAVQLTPDLTFASWQWHRRSLACLRRLADLCLAAALLMAALPLMAIVALAIKLSSAGPVFTRCRRFAADDGIVTILQFRVTAAPRRPVTVCWDSETTLVGRALCRTGIDSLPQLFNVLRGDMTLFGRTAERPDFLAHR